MTDHTHKTTHDDATSDLDLQSQLDQAQQLQDDKIQEKTSEELEKEIISLTKKLEETEQITKRAQSDYIHLKFDFDSYMSRTSEQAKTAEVDTLINVAKKFTPFIDGLRQSLANIPDSERGDTIVQGVQMVYDKFLSTLEQMNIRKIESIGQLIDINLHEAVSALPVEDKNQKGKIIQEFEQWFIYEKWDIRKVVTPAKVVVGQ